MVNGWLGFCYNTWKPEFFITKRLNLQPVVWSNITTCIKSRHIMLTNRIKNQHLLWRAVFGPMAENAAGLDEMKPQKLWELLLQTSAAKPAKLVAAQDVVDYFMNAVKDQPDPKKRDLTKEQRKEIQELSKEGLKRLNLMWLDEMINSEAQLREKMSFFWHGHFACREINSFYQQEMLQVIRENALGNFGDLLRAISKSPSMLQFLNNQQNRKQHPNENFAREVMELFTLGRGNYTEEDIKEAARAFTGWGFNMTGEFLFREPAHDMGIKTVLGKSGYFNGDDVLNILLEQKQTARYITKKIYRFFVNDVTDDQKVEWLSDRFYKNQYDIKKLLEDIFTSGWFYEEKNIGTHIKSPIELLAGIRRLLPMQLENDQSQLLFQRALGQILFYPPNVAGWPGGKNWIDSSSLMLRLRIPQLMSANELPDLRPKNDDDLMMGQMMDAGMKRLKAAAKGATATINWGSVNKVFEKTSRENLFNKIAATVLQTKTLPDNKLFEKYINNESRENYIKSSIINLMSTPEYQLC